MTARPVPTALASCWVAVLHRAFREPLESLNSALAAELRRAFIGLHRAVSAPSQGLNSGLSEGLVPTAVDGAADEVRMCGLCAAAAPPTPPASAPPRMFVASAPVSLAMEEGSRPRRSLFLLAAGKGMLQVHVV